MVSKILFVFVAMMAILAMSAAVPQSQVAAVEKATASVPKDLEYELDSEMAERNLENFEEEDLEDETMPIAERDDGFRKRRRRSRGRKCRFFKFRCRRCRYYCRYRHRCRYFCRKTWCRRFRCY